MSEAISVEDLQGLAESAASGIFGTEDSEQEQPAAENEDVDAVEEDDDDGDLDELDDLDLEDDVDPEAPDTDEDDEDEEDQDDEDESDDEEDDEDLEDEDDEDSEDEDDEDDDQEDDEPPLYTVKVQGQEFEVPVEELVAGYQRQQDYTLKTQQVSDIYNKMSQWYETRANDPEAWVSEIVTGHDDPAAVIAGAIRNTGEATTLLGQTLKHLVQSGEIADELVDALNLKQVAEQAQEEAIHLKVSALERQLQERDQQAQESQQKAAQLAQVEQEINRQWTSLGLEFDDPVEEANYRDQVLSFALERGIPSVVDAYTLMTSQAGSQAAPATPKTKRQKKAKSAVKKRKTAAMSRQPTGGTSRKAGKAGSGNIVADAAAEALAELGLSDE